MSDVENMDVMLGTYSRDDSHERLDENIEMDSRSNGPRHDMVSNCEDFRTLLNTESRSENGIQIDTARLISTEATQEVARKFEELKKDMNIQITESINSAIHETLLPSLQSSLSGQNSRFGTKVDSTSSRLSRNTEGTKHQNVWENTQIPISMNSNHHPQSRDGSLSSLDGRGDHDTFQ